MLIHAVFVLVGIMNKIQSNIVTMLKEQPLGKLAIMKHFPEDEMTLVQSGLSGLIIGNKLDFDGHLYSVAKKRNKYGNIPVTHDDIWFQSKLEGNRYLDLKMMENKGIIKDLKLQVPFVISDPVEWEDRKLPAIKYVVDFTYYDIGTCLKIAEDVKGKETDLYKLKRARFIHRYPEYRFKEVKKDSMNLKTVDILS